MRDRTSKLIGAAIAAGLLLNGTVGLLGFLHPEKVHAAAPQAVYLTDQRGMAVYVRPYTAKFSDQGVETRYFLAVEPLR